MRRIVLFVLLAAVAVGAAWAIAGLAGHVSATIAGLTIETSTPMGAMLLLVVLALLYALLRLLGAVVHAPRRWRRWRVRRNRAGGDRAVTRALVAIAAASPAEARREAARARRLLGDTPQTLLLAAEAGRLAGSETEAAAHYTALVAQPEAAFLGLRGLLRQAMARNDHDAAAALAIRAEAAHPGAAWLREERLRLALARADWAGALTLAPIAAQPALAAAAAEASTDGPTALALARRAWKADRSLSPAALAYARRLREAGHEKRAQTVIEASWALAPQPDLAAFALSGETGALSRASAAARLAVRAPDHPESHLLLARTALAAGLIGEAHRHAEAAERTGLRGRRRFLLAADLAAAERGEAAAGTALRSAAEAGPDAGWRCAACGTTAALWAPVCPACGALGRMEWTAAPGP